MTEAQRQAVEAVLKAAEELKDSKAVRARLLKTGIWARDGALKVAYGGSPRRKAG